jgi:gamma-glutamyl:cysteine ligase YbdK (ATP-grasp superfamily)
VKPRSVGVEEELLLVEPGTGRPSAVAASVLRAAEQHPAEQEVLEYELQQEQLETNTEPRRTLDDLGAGPGHRDDVVSILLSGGDGRRELAVAGGLGVRQD